MKMSKRGSVRTISFLSAAVISLAIYACVNAFNLAVAERELQRGNERALTQLGTYLDDINVNLQKCMYSASDEMLSEMASDLWRSSASAKESLAEITDGNTEVSAVYRFLSQVGEYTLSLNKKLAEGKTLSQGEADNLKALLKYSEELSDGVNYLISQEENGLLDFEEIKSTLQEEGRSAIYIGDELNDANQSLNEYPTLIYDGPFSDHINNKKSLLVEGLEQVSEDTARRKAEAFIGGEEGSLKLLSKTENNLSTYNFYNGDYTVSVTQKGGLVCYMLTGMYASEIKLTQAQAVELATQYLNSKGYTKIKESYYSTTDGICTINFSFYENGITCYTDLIKVSVALDDGTITAFDATGYLMNHTQRIKPEKVKYTIQKGAELLKSGLKLISYKEAYIPTEWETEVYVYEYRCKTQDDNEILVYIDPQTGEEVNILILLYSDNGVLTR